MNLFLIPKDKMVEAISVLVVSLTTLVALAVASYAYGMANVEEIKANWVQYRCNPMYMPLAGMMGSDVGSNFIDCTMQSVNTYAGFVLDPIYNNFTILTDTIKMILDSMNSMRAAVNGASSGFLMIVQSVLGKLQNTFQTVIQLIGRTRTIVNRMIASFAVLMNIVSTGVQTGQSVANGPIGKAGAFLQHCFHPDTLIPLAGGVVIRISDIENGDIMMNGHTVQGVMQFDGMETPMFTLPDPLGDIVVSGSHKVLYNNTWIRVENHPAVTPHNVCPRIYCLNVEGREFPIGHHIFKDYEETDDPAILRGFFKRVYAVDDPTLQVKLDSPLLYRFTGVGPESIVILKDGSGKAAEAVQIGDQLMNGGAVIGRIVHESVELTSYRGCSVARGTLVDDQRFAVAPSYGHTGPVIQFVTEGGRFALANPSGDPNEIVVGDARENAAAPTAWHWRDRKVCGL